MPITISDPATEGSYEWTQQDLDTALEMLGKNAAQGKFDPATWDGDNITVKFADGVERECVPKYIGYIASLFQQRGQGD